MLVVACGPADAIDWREAVQHVGEKQTVRGRVIGVTRDGNVARLRFSDQPDSFSVALVMSLFGMYRSDPERLYVGQEIEARGEIRKFRDILEMAVTDPAHIVILGNAVPEDTSAVVSTTPAAPTPAPPDGKVAAPPNLTCEQRLERAEQRIAELEGRLGESR